MTSCEDFSVEIPTVCPICGGKDIYMRIRPKANAARVVCRDCNESTALKHIENHKYRTTRDTSWSVAVRARYGHRCAICGSTEDVEAHHIIPWSVCPEERYNINNGIALCKECHRKAHTETKPKNIEEEIGK